MRNAPSTERQRAVLARLLSDESGQDTVEYALLGAIVAIASILAWQSIVTTIGNVYRAADTDVQGLSACTPNPGGGGCP